jgi:hypothetical protein
MYIFTYIYQQQIHNYCKGEAVPRILTRSKSAYENK